MNVPDLLLLVECYVGLRRAIGYTVRYEEKLLKDFVQFLASQNVQRPDSCTEGYRLGMCAGSRPGAGRSGQPPQSGAWLPRISGRDTS